MFKSSYEIAPAFLPWIIKTTSGKKYTAYLPPTMLGRSTFVLITSGALYPKAERFRVISPLAPAFRFQSEVRPAESMFQILDADATLSNSRANVRREETTSSFRS